MVFFVSLVAIYPWGSGNNSATRNKDVLDYIADLQRQGMSNADACKGVGMTVQDYRSLKSIVLAQEKQAKIGQAERLAAKGMSNVAIGTQMGINESSVRALLAPGLKDKADVLQATANRLKERVDEVKYLDIGVGVERNPHIGVSRQKLDAAILILRDKGYVVHKVKVEQAGTGHLTELKILTPPGTQWKDVKNNMDKIRQFTDYSEDGGFTYNKIQPPLNISSKRIGITYAEEGGSKADGIIYVRPGIEDLSLGSARYAQVRIAVDGTHYLKGMAMQKDDLPPGVDLMFNTNKSNTGNKLDAMKELKDDTTNPFGSIVRQRFDDPNKPTRVTSVMNVVNQEGAWEKWGNTLSSQMLSKQNSSLAKTQLDLIYHDKKADLDEISHLTNAGVRKKLLESFADDADSSAVKLMAAAPLRTGQHVILPINSLKENEIYAPNFRAGERVVLIRHPHGGVFEIPELVVNNKNPEAKRLLGNAKDAVGIHSRVAERLSGADFDGDTVLVIPNNSGKIKTKPMLEGLKNFNPKIQYRAYEGMKPIDGPTKQREMGRVSNLISDMTIKGANEHELAAAVRHSMVVIDAENHNLNYKQSALDNNIPSLMKKYQGKAQGGASTIVSLAKSRKDVPERKQGFRVDKATGKKIFTETGRSYVNAHGKTIFKTQIVKKLADTEDAHTLSSGMPIEKVYADHSNKLKALANQARKEAVNTQNVPYSSSARTAYAKEVASLHSGLNLALRNAPLERQAQIIQSAIVSAKMKANPDMDKAEIKKLKFLELDAARKRVGAKKPLIEITDSEWNAIQAGAISNNELGKILNNTNLKDIKERATPRARVHLMTNAKTQRAIAMQMAGYTQGEVAEALGVSVSTLKKALV